MRIPLPLLGFSAQLPLQLSTPANTGVGAMTNSTPFALKEGADVFSPKKLVELGRPDAGVANHAGDLVLVPYSQFSFKDNVNRRSLYVAPVESTVEPIRIELDNGGEAFWLSGRTLARVIPSEKDKKLDVFTQQISFQPDASVLALSGELTHIGSIPTLSATNFRFSAEGQYLVFSDYVYSDRDLTKVNEHDAEWDSRGTTALVYDTTYERHWDTWVLPKKQSLFSVKLQQDPDHVWHLATEFTDLLGDIGHSSPVEPFGGTDDFDISKDHVVYTTLDPGLPPAWHTKQDVYLVDISGRTRKQLTSGKQGATHSPVLSKDGSKAAWLELDEDGYEADRAKIVIYDLTKDVRYTLTQDWDRSPDSLAFSQSGEFIYFTAGDLARIKTFVLPLPDSVQSSTTHPELGAKYSTPIALTHTGAASGLQTLLYGRLLISVSSLTSPNDVFVIKGLQSLEEEIKQLSDSDNLGNIQFKGEVKQVTHFTEDALKGTKLSPGEDFWFKGANDKDIQGWVVKPPGFKEGDTKRWPVVLLIHGGPQGAWEDQWSTRWNPNVFAQQGYFAVLINPTGSTTFGQELTDAIERDWGGKPFVDMQKGWKYVLDKYPEIDADRAVAAGASWGGYAINWIQGHPEFGFHFKALVCHDGVFDAPGNGFATDELFFFNHEWGGRPWDEEAKHLLELYSPHNFVDKWGTPQLIIHGSKDYRLPETEGIGAFHALQQLGVPSRLVIFPDENHWVLKHGNSLKWHYEVFHWFDKFVGENGQQ